MLMFGQARNKNTLIKEVIQYSDYDDYVNKVTKRRNEMNDNYVRKRDLQNDRSRANANKVRRTRFFKPGEIVMLKNHDDKADIIGSALLPKLIGPYIVMEAIEKRQQCIIKSLTNNSTRIAHYNHLYHVPNTLGTNDPINTDMSHVLRKPFLRTRLVDDNESEPLEPHRYTLRNTNTHNYRDNRQYSKNTAAKY